MAMEDCFDKSLLKSRALLEYVWKTSSYPKEHEQLKQLREATIEKYKARAEQNVAIDEAQFMGMLLKIMNAKKTLELGVFTGYSLLTTALALPEDGKITAIDPDKEAYEVGLPFIKKAGVQSKIDFINSDASSVLNDLLNKGEEGSYDFAFVDADKVNYTNYHESLLKLVKVGGVIAYDNTLWYGSVALSDKDPMPNFILDKRDKILKVNDFLAGDSRVESAILSIGDGLTLCRRI